VQLRYGCSIMAPRGDHRPTASSTRRRKFERAKTAGIERMVNGIALTRANDEARIAVGRERFDVLYEAWRRKKT